MFQSRQPAINAPRIILILSVVMGGVHVLRLVAEGDLARDILIYGALIPLKFVHPDLLPGSGVEKYLSFITYSFLHGDMTHLTVNLLTMLAFGSIAAWRLGTVRFLALSSLCAIGGGLAHLLTHWGDSVPVIGASAIVSGHMAVAVRFLSEGHSFFLARGENVADLAPLSARGILRSKTALTFLLVWFGVNLFIGLGGGTVGESMSRIAWEAHLGGFLTGLVLFPWFDHRAHINPER